MKTHSDYGVYNKAVDNNFRLLFSLDWSPNLKIGLIFFMLVNAFKIVYFLLKKNYQKYQKHFFNMCISLDRWYLISFLTFPWSNAITTYLRMITVDVYDGRVDSLRQVRHVPTWTTTRSRQSEAYL